MHLGPTWFPIYLDTPCIWFINKFIKYRTHFILSKWIILTSFCKILDTIILWVVKYSLLPPLFSCTAMNWKIQHIHVETIVHISIANVSSWFPGNRFFFSVYPNIHCAFSIMRTAWMLHISRVISAQLSLPPPTHSLPSLVLFKLILLSLYSWLLFIKRLIAGTCPHLSCYRAVQ